MPTYYPPSSSAAAIAAAAAASADADRSENGADRSEQALADAEAIATRTTFAPTSNIVTQLGTTGLSANNGGYPVVGSQSGDAWVVEDKNFDLNDLDAIMSESETQILLGERTIFGRGAATPVVYVGTYGLTANNGGYPALPTVETPTLVIPDLPVNPNGRPIEGGAYDFKAVPTESLGIISTGMSQGMGLDTGTLTDVSNQYTGNLKMLGSIRYEDSQTAVSSGWVTTWTASDEATWGSTTNAAAEFELAGYASTGMVGFGNMLIQHLNYWLGGRVEESGIQIMLGNTGAAGQVLADVTVGGTYYVRTTDWLGYHKARATAASLATARLAVALLDDGGQDTTAGTNDATYQTTLLNYPAALKASQTAVPSVTAPVFVGVEQQALNATYTTVANAERKAWLIECAQARAAMLDPHMFLTGVGYDYTYHTDNRHQIILAMERKGARKAIRVAQLLATGILPVYPGIIRVEWSASGCYVTFGNGTTDIIVDPKVPNPTGFNYGFAFHDASDVVVPVTSCTQVGTNKWFVGGTTPSGTKLSLGRCALPNGVLGPGAVPGPTFGARTCFRDQAGEHYLNQVTIDGVIYKLHNRVARSQHVRP